MTRAILTHGIAESQLWTPKLLGSALKAWWDADDASTITLSSGAVTDWTDKSGNGRTLSQSTSGKRPTTTTVTGMNSRTAVRFDGVDDNLTGSTSGLSATMVAFFVADIVAYGSYSPYWMCSGDNRIVFQINSTGEYQIYCGTGLIRGTRTLDPVLIAAVYNGSNSALWVNGTQQGTTGNAGTLGPSGTFYLGSAYNVTNFYANVDIGEVLLVTGSVAAADRQKTEGYLAWRWGLQGNLPSDHPYKNYRP